MTLKLTVVPGWTVVDGEALALTVIPGPSKTSIVTGDPVGICDLVGEVAVGAAAPRTVVLERRAERLDDRALRGGGEVAR